MTAPSSPKPSTGVPLFRVSNPLDGHVLAYESASGAWKNRNPSGIGVTSITGTPNQVIASSSIGSVILSTPQDINTTSAVQFGTLQLGSLSNNPATNWVEAIRQSANGRPTIVAQRQTDTSPTGDFLSFYDIAGTPNKLFNVDITGAITAGSYAATSISTTYTDAKLTSVAGTANQIAVSASTGAVTFSLVGPYTPSTYTAHGVLVGESTSSIAALTVGTNGQVLVGSSSADPVFATVGTGTGISTSVGAGTITINNTGVTSITGTSNQVVRDVATGAVTLSLPQSIDTAAVVQFGTTQLGSLTNTPASNWVIAARQSANNRRTLILQRQTDTSPTGDFLSFYDIAATPNKLFNVDVTGSVTVGSYSATSISTTYTDAKLTSVAGTANQIAVSASTGAVTFSLVGPYTPATYTAHGLLVGEGTSSVVALAVGTSGQLLVGSTGADPVFATVGTGTGISTTLGAGTFTINNTGVTSITGTANQVVRDSATGAVTLSLPQSIDTAAIVQFGTLQLGSLTNAPATNWVFAARQSANNRRTIIAQRQTDTSPTGDFLSFYDIAATPNKLFNVDITGSITIGSYTASSIAVTYTDAKVVSVAGTTNRITSSGTNPATIDISASYVGQSSITTLGTVGTGVWQGTAVAALYGGTGLTSYAVGDLIYASATTPTLSKLAAVAVGQILISQGTSTAPVWSATGALTTLILGTGDTTGTLGAGTLRGPAASGTDIDAVDLTGKAPQATGKGASGRLIFQATASPNTTGSTVQTLTNFLVVGNTHTAQIGVTGLISYPANTYVDRITSASGTAANTHYIAIGQMTLQAGNSITDTDSASLYIVGAPVKSTNVAATNVHGLLIAAGSVSTATNSYGITANAQTGATNNYAAQFLGGNVGIKEVAPDYLLVVGTSSTGSQDIIARNTNSGTAAFASVGAFNGTAVGTSVRLIALGASFTTVSAFVQNYGVIDAGVSLSGFSLVARGGPILFASNGIAEQMRLSSGILGVGTTSPVGTAQLTKVVGADSVGGALVLDRNAYAGGAGNYRGGAIFSYYYAANASLHTDTLSFAVTSANTPIDVTKVKMVIDEGGFVGVGTTSPSARLTVDGASAIVNVGEASRLLIVRSTTAAGTDVGAQMSFSGETGQSTTPYAFATIAGRKESATAYAGYLQFSTTAGTSGVIVEAMRITSAQQVGIGMTPTVQFELSGSVGQKATGTTWSNPSSRKIKRNIRSFDYGIHTLSQLNPVWYELNGLAGTTEGLMGVGLIAEEAYDIIPHAFELYTAKLRDTDTDETNLYRFDASSLTFMLINAVKEQNIRLETHEQKISTLTAKGSVENIQTSSVGIGNTADTTDDILFSYLLPRNKLSNNGKFIRCLATGHFASTPNTKQVKFWFAGAVIADSGVVVSNGIDWVCTIDITRLDSTHVSCVGKFESNGLTNTVKITVNLAVADLLVNGSTIKITGASTTTGISNDIIGYQMRTELMN